MLGVEFDGLWFNKDKKSGYYLNSKTHKRLHRYVYEFHFGDIEKEYHIHHKDRNKDNNHIDNLEKIECKKHCLLHGVKTEKEKERLRENLDKKARPLAIAWHKSAEGRVWHKKHYENHKENLHKEKEFVCLCCGKSYKTVKRHSKFCSNVCKSKNRRNNKVDDVERECVFCGVKFNTNKYNKTETCSRGCANRIRAVRKHKTN